MVAKKCYDQLSMCAMSMGIEEKYFIHLLAITLKDLQIMILQIISTALNKC